MRCTIVPGGNRKPSPEAFFLSCHSGELSPRESYSDFLMLYITEQDVHRFLDMPRAISLMRDAFQGLADGTAVNHPRKRLILPTGSVLHYMAAGNSHYYGA